MSNNYGNDDTISFSFLLGPIPDLDLVPGLVPGLRTEGDGEGIFLIIFLRTFVSFSFFLGLVPIPEVAPGAIAVLGPVPGRGLTQGLVPVASLPDTGNENLLGRDRLIRYLKHISVVYLYSVHAALPPVGLILVVGQDHVPVLHTGDAIVPGPVPDHLLFQPLVLPEEAQAPRDQLTSEPTANIHLSQ